MDKKKNKSIEQSNKDISNDIKLKKSIELLNIVRVIEGHDYNLNKEQLDYIKQSLDILCDEKSTAMDCSVRADKLINMANIKKVRQS